MGIYIYIKTFWNFKNMKIFYLICLLVICSSIKSWTKKANGTKCTSNYQCSSFVCWYRDVDGARKKVCTDKGTVGQECRWNSQCESRKCKKVLVNGNYKRQCTKKDEETKKANNEKCRASFECKSNMCKPNRVNGRLKNTCSEKGKSGLHP